MNDTGLIQLTQADAVRIGARDLPTFGHIFFPKTFRQKSPPMHYDISRELENPANRLIGLKVYRDGAKTSIGRAYIAKRIAYCISRTVMIVNISSPKAQHSLRWLKRQVEYNRFFADAFMLRKGEKWSDDWAVFINSQGDPVNVVALGITGGLRGLNIDDYRPDLIFCDDINDRENTGTDDQLEKRREEFFAQLVRSLAPRSEAPMSQLVLAQTPIVEEDIISQASRDPSFVVTTYSCFGPDGQSSWPERRPTEELLQEKAGYIRRNQLSTWLAEMECQLTSKEEAALNPDWIRYWQVFPDDGRVAIILDPASSEEKTADMFAVVVELFWRGKVYVLDYEAERGIMPDVAFEHVVRFTQLYGARDLVVETTAYQRILAWYLEGKLKERRIFLTIHKVDDRRKKEDRIIQAITMVAPYGNLLLRESMPMLEEQFRRFGPGYRGLDDVLDAVATGITWNSGRMSYTDEDAVEGEFRRLREEDDARFPDKDVGSFQGAP